MVILFVDYSTCPTHRGKFKPSKSRNHIITPRVPSRLPSAARGVPVRLIRANLFELDLKRDVLWRENGPILVVGNPPWVTNSELGALASTIRPPRSKVKGMTGLEARTGASNFDVAEACWLKLAHELADQNPTIALLCKTSVARSILQFAQRTRLPVTAASVQRIDAAHWFGAAVDACLFCVTLGDVPTGPAQALRIPVFSGLGQRDPESIMGFGQGWLVANLMAYDKWTFADGNCPMNWRQGLKHDAAGVMELVRDLPLGQWCNRAGENVDVEPDFVYPLLKGTDLAGSRDPRWRARRSSHAGSPGRRYRAAGRSGSSAVGLSPIEERDFLEAQIIDLSRPTGICAFRYRSL